MIFFSEITANFNSDKSITLKETVLFIPYKNIELLKVKKKIKILVNNSIDKKATQVE